MNKDDTFWSVLRAAIELDFRRGHLRWKMSELSRDSKVTRSLIYYYFGKSKENILVTAVKLIGEEFFGLTPLRVQMWKDGKIAESLLLSRRLLERVPHIGTFYMVHREEQTEIGASLRQLELEYRKKIKRFFPDSPAEALDALFALFMGLTLTPRLSDPGVLRAVNEVVSLSRN